MDADPAAVVIAAVWLVAVIVLEFVLISLPFYLSQRRWQARDRAWHESPAAIPHRDLRSVDESLR